MSSYQTILYEVDQHVAVVTLNRPDRRNALTDAMLDELTAAFAHAGKDEAVRSVVLTGAGKGFCAGQDLGLFDGIPTPDAVRATIMEHYKPLIIAMTSLPKPIVGAINGAAAGAGASIALACDLRIMAEDAFLIQAFSNIALVPDAGSSWFLVRHVGYSRAFEIAAEAERISAARCHALGLTNKVTSPAMLRDDALAWAHALAARPTYALGLTKQAMMQAVGSTLEEAIALEAEMQVLASQSHDHREGVTAFLEKRAPIFQGR